jgi:DNA-binding LytR/AlgR family response regulator
MSEHSTPLILRCLIADDEPLAREGLRKLISQVPFLELTGMAKDSAGVIELLGKQGVDLLFLDIQMPGLSGIDLARSLPLRPPVIFTTAYSEYALEGYELDILDYLLKPVTEARFLKAVHKARAYYERQTPAFIYVKSSRKIEKVMLADILCIEARLNYVMIHLEKSKIITYASIKSMSALLPSRDFRKVHKSFIVSVARIKSIDGNILSVGDKVIPISRGHKTALMQSIIGSGSPPPGPS